MSRCRAGSLTPPACDYELEFVAGSAIPPYMTLKTGFLLFLPDVNGLR